MTGILFVMFIIYLNGWRRMFKKKEKKIELTELEKSLKLISDLNIELAKELKKTVQEIKDLRKEQGLIWSVCTGLTNCVLSAYNGFDEVNGEVSLKFCDKTYTITPNYRNSSLMNKEIAIKVIEIDKDGNQTIKYTSLGCLTKDEKKEYKEDGFIVIKVNKENDETE